MEVPDPRRKRSCVYGIEELILASVFMNLFRCESRNGFNQQRDYQDFRKNYQAALNLKAPHMDTVDAVLERINPSELASIQTHLVKILLNKRVFHKFRMLNKYFVVAIDGTGIYKFDKEPYSGCPHRTSKNGKITYTQSIVEAKLICPNGFCVSLGTEFMTNKDGEQKQDCEYKATIRLLDKLKRNFNRLPICIVMDGLFFKKPIMENIKSKQWEFLIVWKDKTRYALQEIVQTRKLEKRLEKLEYNDFPSKHTRHEYVVEWSNEPLEDGPMPLYYLRADKMEISTKENVETICTKFVYVSSLNVDRSSAKEIFLCGRRRWMIENEGFNYQKNSRLNLHHKMNRHNIWAIKNYYICLQIAHLISQLMSRNKKSIIKTFQTLKEVWSVLLNYMKLDDQYKPVSLKSKYNLRY